jgi:hypothetical protein
MSARSFTFEKKRQGNITIDKDMNGVINVLLHGHKVCSIDSHRQEVTLDSCGYKTVTTKTAINRALSLLNSPHRVGQRGYKWYVRDCNVDVSIEFINGMTLPLGGLV